MVKASPLTKKAKKHGKKTFVKVSNKKAVKNGRHQEKDIPKVKPTKKAVALIEEPFVDEMEELDTEPEFDDTPMADELNEYTDL